ncbi:hypothetical protein GALMADRAFT_1354486 [Galerina marginata CBS 339.88]|uniref:Uncharacterized protein n=1 Tax=Galerina marginata (strain CBS 339.88) TaxID=685588 RepID=A0A067SC60_GALM3|nr:hypothetical protein GALMADRAFT_1354486 [Galerina marginata CBS 339.88]
MLHLNKRRLYMAFYSRVVNEAKVNDVEYHTALLVTPKNLNSSGNDCNLYHVVNKIITDEARFGEIAEITGLDDVGSRGLEIVWEFELRTFSQPTSRRLVGVMFLGKGIQRPVLERQDQNWRCRHWIWDAVNALIAQLGNALETEESAETVWQRGLEFLRARQSSNTQDVTFFNVLGEELSGWQ